MGGGSGGGCGRWCTAGWGCRCRVAGALPAALHLGHRGMGYGGRGSGHRGGLAVTAEAGGRRRGGRDGGLPGGAVTFLFTDIEGSTRLVKALRDRYAQVLADHQRLIRAAITEHDGHEVDTQGDAFFAAFASAKQAVLCALAIQLGLAAHPWPADGRVRVRIGIHTGHAVPAGGRYTGLAVHRAARIAATARGGQVLVSQATQSIIADEEEDDPEFTLADLGEQKLKDLDRPVRLFQLTAPGLDDPSPELPGPAAAASAPVRGARWRRLVGADSRKRLLAVGGAVVLAVSVLVAVAARGGPHFVAAANTVGVIDTGQPGLSAVVTGVGRPSGVAAGAGAVWVTDSANDLLSRINPATHAVVDQIPVGRGPSGVAFGGGQVWVANQLDGTVSEVNPGGGWQVSLAIPVGIGPGAVAFGFGSVWVANVTSDSLSRIDAATGKVVATIGLGSSPAGVAVGAGSVWVAAQETGELLRVDPAGDRVVQTIPAGQSPDGVAVGAAQCGWPTPAAPLRVLIREPAMNGRSTWVGRPPGSPTPTARSGSPTAWPGALTGSTHDRARCSSSALGTSRPTWPPSATGCGPQCCPRSPATTAARSPLSTPSHLTWARQPTRRSRITCGHGGC